MRRRIAAVMLTALTLGGCRAVTPETPAQTTEQPAPAAPVPYTGDLSAATGITCTLINLTETLSAVGFTSENIFVDFMSLCKRCEPLAERLRRHCSAGHERLLSYQCRRASHSRACEDRRDDIHACN